MTEFLADVGVALPETFLLTMISIILVIDLFLKDDTRGTTYILSIMSLILTSALVFTTFSGSTETAFAGSFIVDKMAVILKGILLLVIAVVFVYSRDYLVDRNFYKGEFFTLSLFGALGMMLMVSSANFLTIYLGLELLSLSMYALVAMQRDSSVASEAAMKYFVLGAIASGMLLYGMSILFGVCNSLDLAQINSAIQSSDNRIALSFALVFIILGVAFKLGAVPFHMWMPDVYHGSPNAVTIYIATAPKIAGFVMLYRLLVDGMGPMVDDWQSILMILTFASMFVGNIIAIAQTNIKRMLAYSTISHVGFLMMGILTGTNDGYSASMFYVLSYVLMSLAAFGMVLLMSRAGFEAENIDDFRGLNKKNPWFAFIMLITMFSMAGVPPMLGFWAKISVLQEAINAGFVWLAVAGVVASIIGAYYYLRIVKVMYFDEQEDDTPIQASMDMRIILSVNGLSILALGVYPAALLAICAATFA